MTLLKKECTSKDTAVISPLLKFLPKAGTSNVDHLLDLILLAPTGQRATQPTPWSTYWNSHPSPHRDAKRGAYCNDYHQRWRTRKRCIRRNRHCVRSNSDYGKFPRWCDANSTYVQHLLLLLWLFNLRRWVHSLWFSKNKKDAENIFWMEKNKLTQNHSQKHTEHSSDVYVIPIIIKTDAGGTAEAVKQELVHIELDNVKFKFIKEEVGVISEKDIRMVEQTLKLLSSDLMLISRTMLKHPSSDKSSYCKLQYHLQNFRRT